MDGLLALRRQPLFSFTASMAAQLCPACAHIRY